MELTKILGNSIKRTHKAGMNGGYLGIATGVIISVGLSWAFNFDAKHFSSQERQKRIQEQINYITYQYDLDSNGVIDSSEVRRVIEQRYSR